MLTEPRHRKFAWRVRVEVARASVAGQLLFADLLLQRHEGVDERFGPRRAAGNVHIDGNVAVDAFEHVVALLERAAGNRARAHRDDILRFGHLVVEPHDLRRHFLRHRAGDNHQVGLAR